MIKRVGHYSTLHISIGCYQRLGLARKQTVAMEQGTIDADICC